MFLDLLQSLRVLSSVEIFLALQAVYFGLWLAVLSWEDLSVALPLQALSYLVVAFLAQWFLGEQVSGIRWAGICLICAGVALVTRSGVNI